jgi:hypothetical protein
MSRNAAIVLAHLVVYAALAFSILQYLRFKETKKRLQIETFLLLTGATLLSLSYSLGIQPAPWWLSILVWLGFLAVVFWFGYSANRRIPIATYILMCGLQLWVPVSGVFSMILMDLARDSGWSRTSLSALSVVLWILVVGSWIAAVAVAARLSWKYRGMWRENLPLDE